MRGPLMRAFLFPGQGSQKVGMDAGLSRRRFDEADEALGFTLSKIIAEGPDSGARAHAASRSRRS